MDKGGGENDLNSGAKDEGGGTAELNSAAMDKGMDKGAGAIKIVSLR
ncbi:MAG: hypothetical protein IKX32_02355 [Bacteroidales bacterium]|nr:hypothetical protein [Bacteroidales bacterium]